MRASWRFPLIFTACVLSYLLVCDLVLAPVHERHGGEITGWLNGLARMLALPGLCIAETSGARFRSQTGWGAWTILIVSSVPIYLVVGSVLRWLWTARAFRGGSQPLNAHTPDLSHPTPHSDAAPSEARDIPVQSDGGGISRRGLFLAARRAAVMGIAGTAGYGFLVELRNVEITRRIHRVRGLSQSLSGLRVVQLTDLHHGPWTSLSYLRRVVEQTNALKPDLVVLTGDYVHHSDIYIRPVVQLLGTLRARVGVVATMGNHDWWEDGGMTAREFAGTSIRLIDNDRLFVTAERTLERRVGASDQKHAMCIAGIGDLWEGDPDCDAALGGVSAAMPRLVLCHNPDTCEETCIVKQAPRIDLMLSGHTHGGQVSLPGLGTPVTPSRYGQKYAAGLVQGPLCPVYISRGIGTTIIPMRFRVRPEITMIELHTA